MKKTIVYEVGDTLHTMTKGGHVQEWRVQEDGTFMKIPVVPAPPSEVPNPPASLFSDTCMFDEAWVGKCKKETQLNSNYCGKHKGVQCVVCHKQATHSCPETFQFVCGMPLCADHKHGTRWEHR